MSKKREIRVQRELHRRGSKKFGHGWAARQASRRHNHKSAGNPLKATFK